MITAPIRFFLGSSTPSGFRHTASQLYDLKSGWRVYFIKGAPGSGKSGFLKRVAAAVGDEAEVFLCGADPHSLDGVRVESQRLLVLDATSPHACEPQLWGAGEQLIPFSFCTDERQLYAQRDAVYTHTMACRDCHTRCRRLAGEAAALLAENFKVQRNAADVEQIRNFASRLSAREWDKQPAVGTEQRRFLSALTPDGSAPLFETATALCPRIYVITDDYGAVSSLLLEQLKSLAVADGQSVIACACPLFVDSKLEHLLLPQSGVAFLTSNRFHPVHFPVYRRIHAARFTDERDLSAHKNTLSFRARAAAELLDGAAGAMQEARLAHDKLETLTAAATDWNAVQDMGTLFLEKMGL